MNGRFTVGAVAAAWLDTRTTAEAAAEHSVPDSLAVHSGSRSSVDLAPAVASTHTCRNTCRKTTFLAFFYFGHVFKVFLNVFLFFKRFFYF